LASSRRGRFVVLIVLLAVLAAFFASGAHRYLSFEALKGEQVRVAAWYRAHPIGTSAAFFAAYVTMAGL